MNKADREAMLEAVIALRKVADMLSAYMVKMPISLSQKTPIDPMEVKILPPAHRIRKGE